MFASEKVWDTSFEHQIKDLAYNTAPVEAIARNVSYYLRARYKPEEHSNLHFLEFGCGGGINLIWLAEKGLQVSGLDFSPVALELAKRNLNKSGFADKVRHLKKESVCKTSFADNTFDGIVESCVLQHLNGEERQQAFKEIFRLLKPGGLFVGHMLDVGCTVYQKNTEKYGEQDVCNLQEGGAKYYLSNMGLTHFFKQEEFDNLLAGFSVIDPSLISYFLPQEEATRRGYEKYRQSMWTVYAIK